MFMLDEKISDTADEAIQLLELNGRAPSADDVQDMIAAWRKRS